MIAKNQNKTLRDKLKIIYCKRFYQTLQQYKFNVFYIVVIVLKMQSVETLHQNEVISALWNKNAPEKCRIGLADVVSTLIC
jgi:hypothetical protein